MPFPRVRNRETSRERSWEKKLIRDNYKPSISTKAQVLDRSPFTRPHSPQTPLLSLVVVLRSLQEMTRLPIAAARVVRSHRGRNLEGLSGGIRPGCVSSLGEVSLFVCVLACVSVDVVMVTNERCSY